LLNDDVVDEVRDAVAERVAQPRRLCFTIGSATCRYPVIAHNAPSSSRDVVLTRLST
jgi:hypothetical protein